MNGPPPPPPPKTNRQLLPEEVPELSPDPPPQEIHSVRINGKEVTDTEVAFMMEKYLTPKQLSDVTLIDFIQGYLHNRNASQAARDAGASEAKGHSWLRTPEVFACIKAITDKALMKYGYDAHEVIERVKEISTFDPAELQNPDGTFKTRLDQIRPEVRRAIKKFKAKNVWDTDANGMKVVTGQLLEVEFWDKLKGLEMLGREKQIMKETKRIEHDVTKNMADTLLGASKRGDDRRAIMARDATPQLNGSHTNVEIIEDEADVNSGSEQQPL